MKAFFLIAACCVFSDGGYLGRVQADDQQQAPPPNQSANQMKMDRDTTAPKAGVVGVKSNPVGAPPTGHAGLDPSNGSSAGLGVQIPLGGSDNGATSPKDSDKGENGKDE
jgi:hypothetical protein